MRNWVGDVICIVDNEVTFEIRYGMTMKIEDKEKIWGSEQLSR